MNKYDNDQMMKDELCSKTLTAVGCRDLKHPQLKLTEVFHKAQSCSF